MSIINCHTCLMDKGTCNNLCMKIDDVSLLKIKGIKSTDSRKGRYCTATKCSHNLPESKCDIDICPFARIKEDKEKDSNFDNIIRFDKLKFIFKNGSERVFENVDNIMYIDNKENGIDISITYETRGTVRNTVLKASSIHKMVMEK